MKSTEEALHKIVEESQRVQSEFFKLFATEILEVATTIGGHLKDGRKVLLFGNGGSSADAQHIAAELIGRFMAERSAVPAIALSADTTVLTAIANDYGYHRVFARQLEALAQKGDTAIAISTSGNSENVLAGLAVAKDKGLYTIGLTGETGGKMEDFIDVLFRVPSTSTPRIQEAHRLIGHVLCELIDHNLFPEAYPNA